MKRAKDLTNNRTFQEGFLSKRRVFFTDRPIFYVCNQGMCAETGVWQRKDREYLALAECYFSSAGTNGLERAREIMREYAGRQLWIEADALKALTGALNTLPASAGGPVLHLSGVIFTPMVWDADSPSGIVIALNWITTGRPTWRREFPSWSPLGWKWQNKRNGSSYECATTSVVPRNFSLTLVSRSGPVDLPLLLDTSNGLYEAEKRNPTTVLKIVAPTVRLECRREPNTCGNNTPRMIFSLDATEEFSTALNVNPEDADSLASQICLGLVLCSEEALCLSRHIDTNIPVLLLRACGDHYERIACVEFVQDPIRFRGHQGCCCADRVQARHDATSLDEDEESFAKDSWLWLKDIKTQRIRLA